MTDAPHAAVLLVRAGGRVCAVPVEHVVEAFRPLPIRPVSGAPPFLEGAAVVRGAAVPVVRLDAFLGAPPAPPGRFVLVRCGARAAVLAVDSVVGVAPLDAAAGSAPLLAGAAPDAVEGIAARDGELLVLLRAARVVPDGAWRAIADEREEERA